MEVGEVVNHPGLFEALAGECTGHAWRGKSASAEYDHVEAPRRSIVYPFRGEVADAVGGREVHLFRVDEFIASSCPQVLNVVDKEDVGSGMMCQKDYLCSTFG